MPRSSPRQRAGSTGSAVLQLPEEQWLHLQAVLNQLSTIDRTDSIAEDDFCIALELCQVDETAASVRSLTKKCLAEDGRVDFVTFLKLSRTAKFQAEREPELVLEAEPEPKLQLEPEPEPEMEPTSDERERSVSIDTYQPGDLVEYNSVTLGGWASAVVGKVYPNGQMQLLGDPGPGATRQQIAAAKGHVLKEYAQSLARLQRCLRKCAHLTRCVLLMLPVARIQRACAGAPRAGNHHKRRRLPPPNAVG